MIRSIRATAVALILPSGMTSIGCMGGGGAGTTRPGIEARYNNLVDPCWPQGYSHQARESVLSPFEQQVNNAEILNQTVWNYHFDLGTAKLNANGREKLDLIARKRPTPDGKLYLQTARDLAYDEKSPDKLPGDRIKLDVDRAQAVLAYMSTQPAARTVSFDVQPIDPIDPAMNSQGPATAVRGLPSLYRSGITGAIGGQLTGTGGGQAPGTGAAGTGTGTGTGTGSGGTGTGSGTAPR